MIKKIVGVLPAIFLLVGGSIFLACSEGSFIAPGGSTATFLKKLDLSPTDRLESLVEAPGGSIVAGGVVEVIRGDSIEGHVLRPTGDAFMARFTPTGDTLWTAHFGSYQLSHTVRAIAPAWDGGYIGVGSVSWPGPGRGNFIQKVSENGELDWSTNSQLDFVNYFTEVVRTSDGNYLAVGISSEHFGDQRILLVKFDQGGSEIWDTTYSIPDTSLQLAAISFNADDDILLLSMLSPANSSEQWFHLLRLNSAGDSLFAAKVPLDEFSVVLDAGMTDDGGVRVLGATTEDSRFSSFIAYTDSLGLLKDTRLAHRSGPFQVIDGKFTRDGGAILCGYYDQGDQHEVGLLVRLDADGGFVWEREIKDGTSSIRLNSVIEYSAGGYVVSGQVVSLDWQKSDFLLLKVDEHGNYATE